MIFNDISGIRKNIIESTFYEILVRTIKMTFS